MSALLAAVQYAMPNLAQRAQLVAALVAADARRHLQRAFQLFAQHESMLRLTWRNARSWLRRWWRRTRGGTCSARSSYSLNMNPCCA